MHTAVNVCMYQNFWYTNKFLKLTICALKSVIVIDSVLFLEHN